MTDTTDINIRASADRVIALMEQNRAREALQLLAREREGERPAVQEALDRYVAAGAQAQLAAIRRTGDASLDASLDRLDQARGAPRYPTFEPGPQGSNELLGLTDAQKYDIYASVVLVHGNQAARDALGTRERVVLGLRQENSTLASMDDPRTTQVDESQTRSGKGVYDDRLVVLWKDANGNGRVYEAMLANTEPTAQYDHHAGSNGRRVFSDGGTDRQVRAASEGYEEVRRPRKIEGDDVNGDGIRDLGRLAQGTYEMEATTHALPGGNGAQGFALRPTQAAVRNGQNQVERDSNGDGLFNQADLNGRQPLNASFKVHFGSLANTDSAGCQTTHPTYSTRFARELQGNAQQTRWQYVLVSTTPGLWRDVQTGPNQAQLEQPGGARAAPPQIPPGAAHPPQHHAPPPAAGDRHGERFPPGRADAAMFDAIHRQLPAGTSDAQAAHVMARARENGIRDPHQLDRVAVVDGQAWVIGRTPGFLAKVDLSAPTPSLAETLQRSEWVDQQQAALGVERQQGVGARTA